MIPIATDYLQYVLDKTETEPIECDIESRRCETSKTDCAQGMVW